jgi:ribosome-binding factor A
MKNRTARVQELIRNELGTILARELTFDAQLVTIHTVSVTPDLRTCHVYLSALGEEHEKHAALHKLRDNRIMLQNALSKRVVLKYTPQLVFHLDNSIERGVRVVRLLDELSVPPEEGTGTEPEPHSAP